ncbi:MAG TPA: hypothetical protein VFQ47_06345 [Nitrososphaera sp.]|nr:hypothetical protein [Nitrososphaera sp.]
MNAASPDDFVEFAKNNPVLAEKKVIAFLSSERARADRGEISAGTINNWVKASRLFLERRERLADFYDFLTDYLASRDEA